MQDRIFQLKNNLETAINAVKQKTQQMTAPPVTAPTAPVAPTAAPTATPVTPIVTAPARTGYTVGGNYAPDTTLYEGKTDKNSIAAQAHDKQLAAYQNALQAAYDSQAAANQLEAQKLKSQYDASRSDVYTNNRLSAIGNNERLAALGLAGNIYDYARSGTSETSRINQDVALRRSLAGLDQSENEARNDLAIALLMAQKEADANYANKVAEVETAKIPYLQALAKSSKSVGGSSVGGSSTSKKTSSSKKEEVEDVGSGGSITSVHNAIVSNKNSYAAARQAALQELAKLPESQRVAAAEYANKLLNQFKTTR